MQLHKLKDKQQETFGEDKVKTEVQRVFTPAPRQTLQQWPPMVGMLVTQSPPQSDRDGGTPAFVTCCAWTYVGCMLQSYSLTPPSDNPEKEGGPMGMFYLWRN